MAWTGIIGGVNTYAGLSTSGVALSRDEN